ncbi:MAG: hypothetical protein EOM72_11885 [Opitutae bacterium]|nr:hypothetical protein [Opitutae bacterium]
MASGKVDVGGWITEAWELYKANFALLCVATLVAALLGGLTCGVLAGPLWAGLTLIILRVSRKQEPVPQIGDVFKGFDFFLQALILGVVVALAYAVASSLPVVGPVAGILISPLVMFAMALLVDRKMDFWPALMASFEKAKTEYVSLLVVCLLGHLISMAGALLCGVGVILTAPFSAIVSVVAYRHLFEGPEAEAVPVVEAAMAPTQA